MPDIEVHTARYEREHGIGKCVVARTETSPTAHSTARRTSPEDLAAMMAGWAITMDARWIGGPTTDASWPHYETPIQNSFARRPNLKAPLWRESSGSGTCAPQALNIRNSAMAVDDDDFRREADGTWTVDFSWTDVRVIKEGFRHANWLRRSARPSGKPFGLAVIATLGLSMTDPSPLRADHRGAMKWR